MDADVFGQQLLDMLIAEAQLAALRGKPKCMAQARKFRRRTGATYILIYSAWDNGSLWGLDPQGAGSNPAAVTKF